MTQALTPTTAPLTYTIAEAAALLGISVTTAYECAHRGQLPVLRFGRRLVVSRRTIDELVGASEAQSEQRRNQVPIKSVRHGTRAQGRASRQRSARSQERRAGRVRPRPIESAATADARAQDRTARQRG